MKRGSMLAAAVSVGAVVLLGSPVVQAQAYKVLHSFVGPEGEVPHAGLVQDVNGLFYGTTTGGGAAGKGSVFTVDAAGLLTTLHSFLGSPEGNDPEAGLVLAPDGSLYGTTIGGGSAGFGTLFKIDASGNFTTLHSFAGADGSDPIAAPIIGTDGFLYGTTAAGGASGFGTVYRMDLTGSVTTLHSFNGTDGQGPSAPLVQGSDGNFYGTTAEGGPSGCAIACGAIFKVDSSGNFTSLHAFTGVPDGSIPLASLIEASDGYFYGTTSEGGSPSCPSGCGTVYQMDLAGNVTVLAAFGSAGGEAPRAGLIQGSDGYLYGTTSAGGGFGYGTVFRTDTSGNVVTLHSFDNADGNSALAGLIVGSDGFFYGTTSMGGANGLGVIFREFVCGFPLPVINVVRCVPPTTSGLTASVQSNVGNSYAWSITGGTIDTGQGTDTISFTSGGAGTLVTLQVLETDPTSCAGTATETAEVDFADVPSSNPFHDFVCTIARNGITAGCGAGNFCPGDSVLRSQMAVFLLQGKHGSTYTAPPADCGTYPFADVACPNTFADYILELYNEQITGGCATNPLRFCPGDTVSRAGMAVFLLVAKHGQGFGLPACTGIFADVACPSAFADWIEELYNEGITGGCGTNPLTYCPTNPVTRAQMAVFLTTTFNLP